MLALVVTVPANEAELASDALWALGVVAIEERPADGDDRSTEDHFVELWTSLGDDVEAVTQAAEAFPKRWRWRTVDARPGRRRQLAGARRAVVDRRRPRRRAGVARRSTTPPDVVRVDIDPGRRVRPRRPPDDRAVAAAAARGAVAGGQRARRRVRQRRARHRRRSARRALRRGHRHLRGRGRGDRQRTPSATASPARSTASTTPLAAIDEPFDIVLANLLAPIVVDLGRRPAPGHGAGRGARRQRRPRGRPRPRRRRAGAAARRRRRSSGRLGGPPAASLSRGARSISAAVGHRRHGTAAGRGQRAGRGSRPHCERRAGRRRRGGPRAPRRRRRRHRSCRPGGRRTAATCHSWSWVTTRTPAPPRVVTTAPTPAAMQGVGRPERRPARARWARGRRRGRSSSPASAGGRRRVEHGQHPGRAGQRRRATATVSSGTSSWVSRTSAGGSAATRTSALAPGTTTIEFSPPLVDGDHRPPGRRSPAGHRGRVDAGGVELRRGGSARRRRRRRHRRRWSRRRRGRRRRPG